MTIGATTRVLLLAACMVASGNVDASALARLTAALPEPPAPPSGAATWTSRSMRMNGLPMSVKTFGSRAAPDTVLQHYESWSRTLGRVRTHRINNPPWRLLSIHAACCQITVQARAVSAGSEGTIAVSASLERAKLSMNTRFPRPASVAVVNLQEYDDEGVEAEHISMQSARSPSMAAHAYAAVLERASWSVIRNARGVHDSRAYVIEAQKGAERALITVLPDRTRGGAHIVAIWRKS